MDCSGNIKKYYFYSLFSELLIIGPILVLFMLAKGLNFTEIMVLQSISAVSVVAFEVPTGAAADMIGRKQSLLVGAVLWGVGLLFYITGKKFIMFVLAEVIFSLGSSFKSGADSALIYDSLKTLHRESEYKNIEGRARSYSLYANAVGSIVASYAYKININLPMIISIAFMAVTAIIAASFKEPDFKENENVSDNYYKQVIESGKFILGNEKVKAIILYSMVFAIFYRAGFWYYQPYMESVHIPVEYFGIVFFIFNIIAALSSRKSAWLMNITKPRTLTFMSSLILISFVLLGTVKAWFGVFAILLQQVARGLYRPTVSKYLNKHIPSDKRATILSFESLAGNLTFAAASPFMGMLKDAKDIYSTHLVLAAVMAVLTVLTMFYMKSRLGVKKMDNNT